MNKRNMSRFWLKKTNKQNCLYWIYSGVKSTFWCIKVTQAWVTNSNNKKVLVNINVHIKFDQNPSMHFQAKTLLKSNEIGPFSTPSSSSQYKWVNRIWSKSVHLFSRNLMAKKFLHQPRAITLLRVMNLSHYNPKSLLSIINAKFQENL